MHNRKYFSRGKKHSFRNFVSKIHPSKYLVLFRVLLMYGFDNYFFFFVINFQGNYKKKHFCFVCHALYRYVLFFAYRMIDLKLKKKNNYIIFVFMINLEQLIHHFVRLLPIYLIMILVKHRHFQLVLNERIFHSSIFFPGPIVFFCNEYCQKSLQRIIRFVNDFNIIFIFVVMYSFFFIVCVCG